MSFCIPNRTDCLAFLSTGWVAATVKITAASSKPQPVPGGLAPSGNLGLRMAAQRCRTADPEVLRGEARNRLVRVRRRVAATSHICSGPRSRVGRGSRRGCSLWEHTGHRVGDEGSLGGGPDQGRVGHPVQRG
jgi:hypothetical protein